VLGIQPDRRSIRRLGFGRFAGSAQQHAEIAVSVRVLRVDRDCMPIGVDRRIAPTDRLQNDPEIAVAIGAVRLGHETALDQRDGFFAAALLMREHAGVVQRVSMIGRDGQDAAIQFLRLRELLVLLQQNRDGHRLVERQLACRRWCALRRLADEAGDSVACGHDASRSCSTSGRT